MRPATVSVYPEKPRKFLVSQSEEEIGIDSFMHDFRIQWVAKIFLSKDAVCIKVIHFSRQLGQWLQCLKFSLARK